MQTFSEILSQQGLYAGTAKGDGNCLIHTIQQLITDNTIYWRNAIYNYINNHRNDPILMESMRQTMILRNCADEDEHIESILTNGEMLGSEAIIAIHHIVKQPIEFHIYNIISHAYYSQEFEFYNNKDKIHIGFEQFSSGGHYIPIFHIKKKIEFLPRIISTMQYLDTLKNELENVSLYIKARSKFPSDIPSLKQLLVNKFPSKEIDIEVNIIGIMSKKNVLPKECLRKLGEKIGVGIELYWLSPDHKLEHELLGKKSEIKLGMFVNEYGSPEYCLIEDKKSPGTSSGWFSSGQTGIIMPSVGISDVRRSNAQTPTANTQVTSEVRRFNSVKPFVPKHRYIMKDRIPAVQTSKNSSEDISHESIQLKKLIFKLNENIVQQNNTIETLKSENDQLKTEFIELQNDYNALAQVHNALQIEYAQLQYTEHPGEMSFDHYTDPSKFPQTSFGAHEASSPPQAPPEEDSAEFNDEAASESMISSLMKRMGL